MIVSLNGMDNSGKTTQIKSLMKQYPDYYRQTLHIKNTNAFNQGNYDFDWWFNPYNSTEFVKVLLEALQERNEIAKSIDTENIITLYDKGNDFYESRILATLILKGESLVSAKEILAYFKEQYPVEDVEKLKIFLLPGDYTKKEDFGSDKRILYNVYLELNKLLLQYQNINYIYIKPNEVKIVTDQIHNIIFKESEFNICKKLTLKR